MVRTDNAGRVSAALMLKALIACIASVAFIGWLFPVIYASKVDALNHLVMLTGLWIGCELISRFKADHQVISLILIATGIIASIGITSGEAARTKCASCTAEGLIEFLAPAIVAGVLITAILSFLAGWAKILKSLKALSFCLLTGQQVLLFVHPKLCTKIKLKISLTKLLFIKNFTKYSNFIQNCFYNPEF